VNSAAIVVGDVVQGANAMSDATAKCSMLAGHAATMQRRECGYHGSRDAAGGMYPPDRATRTFDD
jgi:hypothetical protein